MLKDHVTFGLRAGDILESFGTYVRAEHEIDGECSFGPETYICRATGSLVCFGYEYDDNFYSEDKDNLWTELPEKVYSVLPKHNDWFSEHFTIISKCDLYPCKNSCAGCREFCRYGQNSKR
jgi:hypothetical protein